MYRIKIMYTDIWNGIKRKGIEFQSRRSLKHRLQNIVGVIVIIIIMIIISDSSIPAFESSHFKRESNETSEDLMLKDMLNDETLLAINTNHEHQKIEEEGSCTPKNHIMFLKTHKCGSSTVQNIFLRYGFKNNLTFALPKKGNVYLGHPKHFNPLMIDSPILQPDSKVDIFALHSRLSPYHEQVVYPDAVWITIIREPAAVFDSLFSYYRLEKEYHFGLEDLLKLPVELSSKLARHDAKFGRNQMMFDLGLRENLPRDMLPQTTVNNFINHLDKGFNLVMIAEFMDESLILLRHQMCWSLHDIVSFSKNARRDEFKLKFTDEELKIMRIWNTADVSLYDHFLKKHHASVTEFGRQRMEQEVNSLQQLRDQQFNDCGIKIMKGKDPLNPMLKEWSKMVNSYVLEDAHPDRKCVMMTIPEPSLIKLVRMKQDRMLGDTDRSERSNVYRQRPNPYELRRSRRRVVGGRTRAPGGLPGGPPGGHPGPFYPRRRIWPPHVQKDNEHLFKESMKENDV